VNIQRQYSPPSPKQTSGFYAPLFSPFFYGCPSTRRTMVIPPKKVMVSAVAPQPPGLPSFTNLLYLIYSLKKTWYTWNLLQNIDRAFPTSALGQPRTTFPPWRAGFFPFYRRQNPLAAGYFLTLFLSSSPLILPPLILIESSYPINNMGFFFFFFRHFSPKLYFVRRVFPPRATIAFPENGVFPHLISFFKT